ncbi:AAA domain-containing protein [Corallococcus sicarius]|uniref:AAA family ATPase n=1 Tax=Corallococcus sicarius TaxID=2316726 RepID=A0A3A8N652_9BACT|nr:AAA domain-containing protein [Corallococcus sicarius]RKH39726.1 AAA family ATPase [Corallococcus sicarius]
MTESEIREKLSRLFSPGGRLHGRFTPPEDAQFEVLVPGSAWQTFVWPEKSASPHLLRVYSLSGSNPLLAHFWRNETRALHRLSGRKQSALPRLAGAGLIPEMELGYLILDDSGQPLEGNHTTLARLRADRVTALRCFSTLCDALAVLHGEGMMHRSLTPHTIRALDSQEDPVVYLDGFQLSAFVTAWLRGQGAVAEPHSSGFLPTRPSSLACMAPERLSPLFGNTSRHIESFACDVFGLGMIGIDWFAGLPEEECHGIIANSRYAPSSHEQLIRLAHLRLRSAQVPDELCRLLVQMTEPAPSNRMPSGLEVADTLGRLYPSLLAQFESAQGAASAKPHQLYFLRETVERLFRDGMTRSTPTSPDIREYAELVERDLYGGVVTWSPRGFAPWEDKEPEKARLAKTVLMGQRYAYFCQYLNEGRQDENKKILLVKYVCQADKVRELRQQSHRRVMPPIQASYFLPTNRPGLQRPIPAETPAWTTIVHVVRFDEQGEQDSIVAATADWLVRYQEAQLTVQEYRYERQSEGTPRTRGDTTPRPIILHAAGRPLEYDARREVAAFAELFFREQLVPSMGAYFEQRAEQALDEGESLEFILRNEHGEDVPIKLELDAALDPFTVRFKPNEKEFLLPERGTVRPNEKAARIVLSRQRRATQRLRNHHHLLAQLREPRGLSLSAPEMLATVAAGLQQSSPETAKLVRRIIDEEPFFVVQGPPGTGKTFIASHIVKDVIRLDPFGRLLISAQSNAALDNLLENVAHLLGILDNAAAGGPLLLRHASAETEERVSAKARPFLLTNVLTRTRERMGLASGVVGPLGRIQKEWAQKAKGQDFDAEMYSRVQRASNVVFATCAGAGADTESLRAGSGFDWVIVEEAARAWLSEILVPLVQGDRWLLIGDHKQLPAYQRDVGERLLTRDIADRVTAEATGQLPSENMRPLLGHFQHLMTVEIPRGYWTEPRGRIDEQRRMHPDIGNLVSQAYYDGQLLTHPSAIRPHNLGQLPFLKQTALVWIDTSVFNERAYERGRMNFLEMDLLGALLRHLPHFPEHHVEVPPVAVLSPYREQLKRLREKFKQLPEDVFRSVDEVQGRQAEVVFVSLVRNNSYEAPTQGLGFMQSPERANVMFSRARRLLVILGSLTHFERFRDTHWAEVARYVRSEARFIVDPRESPLSFAPAMRKP